MSISAGMSYGEVRNEDMRVFSGDNLDKLLINNCVNCIILNPVFELRPINVAVARVLSCRKDT